MSELYKSSTGIKVGDKHYAYPTYASLVQYDGENNVNVKEKIDEIVANVIDPVNQARVRQIKVTIPASAWTAGSYSVAMSDNAVETYTQRAKVAVDGMKESSVVEFSTKTHITDSFRQIALMENYEGGISFYASTAPTSDVVVVINEGPGVSVTEYATTPQLGIYKASYIVDGWTDASSAEKANGYNYKQTVALVAETENAPEVTENSEFLTAGSVQSTGVAATDLTLQTALGVICDGCTETGSGTVTTLVKKKPSCDVVVRWGLMT